MPQPRGCLRIRTAETRSRCTRGRSLEELRQRTIDRVRRFLEVGAPNAGVIGGRKRELPTAVYRWDPSGKLEVAIPESQLPDPNGLCFSPDYKTLYVISTGQGPGDTGPGGNARSMPSTCKAPRRPICACSPT